MVFIKYWKDFEIAAESMYMENPSKCRFSMKYVHRKGKLVLKLSDNSKCISALVYAIEGNVVRCFLVIETTFLRPQSWDHYCLVCMVLFAGKILHLPCILIILTYDLPHDIKCIQYKADVMPDLKKIEKLTGNLMGQMTLCS